MGELDHLHPLYIDSGDVKGDTTSDFTIFQCKNCQDRGARFPAFSQRICAHPERPQVAGRTGHPSLVPPWSSPGPGRGWGGLGPACLYRGEGRSAGGRAPRRRAPLPGLPQVRAGGWGGLGPACLYRGRGPSAGGRAPRRRAPLPGLPQVFPINVPLAYGGPRRLQVPPS